MAYAEESTRSRAAGDRAATFWLAATKGSDRRSLYHHLTLAAEEIARRDDAPGGVSRFAAAAARFRDLGFGSGREDLGPVVPIADGSVVPLSDLLAAAWSRHRQPFPGQSIDAEMLEAARQLLLELAWVLPDA